MQSYLSELIERHNEETAVEAGKELARLFTKVLVDYDSDQVYEAKDRELHIHQDDDDGMFFKVQEMCTLPAQVIEHRIGFTVDLCGNYAILKWSGK